MTLVADRGGVATDIEGRIKELLVSRLRISAETLAGSDGTTCLLGRGIGIDSIEALTLATAIEEEFRIEVDDGDLTRALFETIGSVVEYVRRRTEGR